MNKQKQSWISDKIGKLKKEGKPLDEAIAVAYSMYDDMKEGGTIKKMQMAGVYTEDGGVGSSVNAYTPPTTPPVQYPQQPKNFNPVASTWEAKNQYNQNQLIYNPFMNNYVQEDSKPPYLQDATTEPLNSSEREKVEGVSGDLQNVGVQPVKRTLTPEEELQKNAQGANNQASFNTRITDPYQPNVAQFFNPYGGVGLEQALNFAGRGFGSGNVGEGLMGATLSGLKIGRNFMSGFAAEKENTRQDEEYRRNIYEEPRYTYAREGGKTQGGVTNGEVLTGNYMVDTGVVMPEDGDEEALDFYNRLKDKEIVSYDFNEETQMYEIKYKTV